MIAILGILYVAASRAQSRHALRLDFQVNLADFSRIGKTKTWQHQHDVVERIRKKALEQRSENNPGQDDKQTLKELILWICDTVEENLATPRDQLYPNNPRFNFSLPPEHDLTSIRKYIQQWRESANKI